MLGKLLRPGNRYEVYSNGTDLKNQNCRQQIPPKLESEKVVKALQRKIWQYLKTGWVEKSQGQSYVRKRSTHRNGGKHKENDKDELDILGVSGTSKP